MFRALALIVVSTFALLAPQSVSAAPTLVPVGSFDRPIFATSDPLDPNRVFVVEREGRIMVSAGTGFELFGQLEALVSCCTSERGLLSIALAPDFASSQRFYAAYTGTLAAGGAEGDIHVDAFRPSLGSARELLREPILTVGHADQPNHNGGQLQFGPDGALYVSTGDGGGAGDPLESGQDTETLLGKILRVEPKPGQEPAYAIPPGNPFLGVDGLDEIWSYGLRNPWRFSFDRVSGDLVIGDVGQSLREEIDYAPSPAPGSVGGSGANYGWNCREGLIAYPSAPASCTGAMGFADPVFDYPHEDPGGGAAHGCSITGGYVVRDAGLGDLYGRYLYADFCGGELRSLMLPGAAGAAASDDRSEGLAVASPVSFGEDSCGRIYVASNDGSVFRLQGDGESGCEAVTVDPAPQPTPPVSVGAAPPIVATPRPQVRLSARRQGDSHLLLVVTVAPCAGAEGAPVQLNRGGTPLQRKRLSMSCEARFRVRVVRSSTFRALFGDQRSQVRTIALAKPRP